MCLYTDWEQWLMLSVASPLPQKYEEDMSICLGNRRRCLAEYNQPFVSEKMVQVRSNVDIMKN